MEVNVVSFDQLDISLIGVALIRDPLPLQLFPARR
jgi:hypothetical protein